MRNRLIVYLSPGERQLLQRMAIEDIRPPDDQIRYLIVNEAIKRGITENQSATGGSLTPTPVALARTRTTNLEG